jgi:hypothetical protein
VFLDGTTLLEADDGGIYQVTNPATSPSAWTSKGGNLGAVELYSVAYDTDDNILFGGVQDNGSNRQSAAGSTTWVQFAGGDGAMQAYDAANDVRYNMQNDLGSFFRNGSQIHLRSAPGAKTERRGGAGPVRDLLGGETLPAVCYHPFKHTRFGLASHGRDPPPDLSFTTSTRSGVGSRGAAGGYGGWSQSRPSPASCWRIRRRSQTERPWKSL